MSKQDPRSGRRQELAAFTLIELLVVISIIAVLAGRLLPAISLVRDQARSTACSSHMRQVGTVLHAYADDFDGLYPPVVTDLVGFSDYWNKKPVWEMLQDQPYSDDRYLTSVFACPLSCRTSAGTIQQGYVLSSWSRSGFTIAARPRSAIRLSTVAMLVAEGSNIHINATTSAVGTELFPHKNRMNVVFNDLHQETRTVDMAANVSLSNGFWY